MEVTPQIERTEDGSATLVHPVYGETYHSVRGAVGESMHIFIENGLKTIDKPCVRILEVGFGTGLNAWLTLEYARKHNISIEYHTAELYPISLETAASLNYTDDQLFMSLHSAPWDTRVEITPEFSITKYECDFAQADFFTIFDIVYFDAFAPDCQPELWRPAIFSRLYEQIDNGGVLVTYSSKGIVKQALRDAGFELHRLPGALGKRHMLRAVKA